MRKILNRILSIVSLGILAVSCTDEVKFGESFIEKAPGGTVTFDTIFSKAEYANQFLTAIYARQYYGLPYNSDVCHSASQWVGKFDALTDLYQIHWEGCAVYYNFWFFINLVEKADIFELPVRIIRNPERHFSMV